MKRLFLAAMMIATTMTVFAQYDYASGRVGSLADQLKRTTSRLADQALRNLLQGSTKSRTDILEALLAQQVDASATLFVEMVRNRRPVVELREVSTELTSLSRRAPASSPQATQWRQVQNAAADVNRELSGSGGGTGPGPESGPIIGRVSWRGTVDDRVQLHIRAKSVEARTISGAASADGVSNFTSALPDRAVQVGVTKTVGRGSVRVLQQPSRSNDYTAVIEIYDNGSGAKVYQLDIVWR